MNSFFNAIGNLILPAAFFLLSTGLHASPYYSPERKKERPELAVEGKIVIKNKQLKGTYKVEVLHYATITNSFNVKKNKSVKLNLKAGAPYTLKISKKGFFPRYICINTANCEYSAANNTYSFYLETDFIDIKEAMKLDDAILEMPAAIISFDKTKGDFHNNGDYAAFVTQKISQGLSR